MASIYRCALVVFHNSFFLSCQPKSKGSTNVGRNYSGAFGVILPSAPHTNRCWLCSSFFIHNLYSLASVPSASTAYSCYSCVPQLICSILELELIMVVFFILHPQPTGINACLSFTQQASFILGTILVLYSHGHGCIILVAPRWLCSTALMSCTLLSCSQEQ